MKYIYLSILLITTVAIKAQTFVMPSQIERNRVRTNPAFTGCYGTAVGNLMHKTTWVGSKMNFSHQSFEFHNPLKNQSIAMGLQAGHEEIGATNNTEIFLNYAYRIRLRQAKLTFGLKAGLHSKSYGNVKLKDDVQDPSFVGGGLMPNFGFGISYYSKKYFFGLSVPYIFTALHGSDGNSSMNFKFTNISYVFIGGGKIPVNSFISIEPVGALVYNVTQKPSYSGVVNANYKNEFIVGLGYKASEAIIINAGYYVTPQVSLMYSYDYTIGDIGAYSSGSHELGLMIYWGFHVNSINPRDF